MLYKFGNYDTINYETIIGHVALMEMSPKEFLLQSDEETRLTSLLKNESDEPSALTEDVTSIAKSSSDANSTTSVEIATTDTASYSSSMNFTTNVVHSSTTAKLVNSTTSSCYSPPEIMPKVTTSANASEGVDSANSFVIPATVTTSEYIVNTITDTKTTGIFLDPNISDKCTTIFIT